jgi:hypothetical protein
MSKEQNQVLHGAAANTDNPAPGSGFGAGSDVYWRLWLIIKITSSARKELLLVQ